MTLRTRLTAAFLAVVLGPIAVGAVATGMVATSITRSREAEELNSGSAAVTSAVGTLCQRARAAAEALAATATAVRDPRSAADAIFARRLADALRLENGDGVLLAGSGDPNEIRQQVNWGDCTTGKLGDRPVIAAGVELREFGGSTLGWARAAFRVDKALVNELAKEGGVGVSVRLPSGAWITAKQPGEATRSVVRTPNPGQPLYLRISTERADLGKLYLIMFMIAGAVSLLAILAARWLARTLTRPLLELAAGAEQVASGDLSTRVLVRGRDELGRLAQTFNRMVRDLQAYVGALTASRDQLRGNLVRLGEALSSSSDPGRIAEVTLETAMAATGAQSGVVLLTETDEYPPRLVGRAVSGALVGTEPDGITVAAGEGIVGQVAQRGLPAKGRIGPKDEFAPTEPRCSTYIAVPFIRSRARRRVFGVLALYDRLAAGERADEFDDADVRALQAFATQAAVALESVPKQHGH